MSECHCPYTIRTEGGNEGGGVGKRKRREGTVNFIRKESGWKVREQKS